MYCSFRVSKKVLAVCGVLVAAVVAGCVWSGRRSAQTLCTNQLIQAAGLTQQVALADSGAENAPEDKVAYLTFDDGPSKTTGQVLDILKESGIQATFFVCAAENNEKYLPVLERTVAEGHQIGLHSCSHSYKKIYRSPAAFWEDLDELWEKISPYVPQKPTCIRFPGGSTNTVSHRYGGASIMKTLKNQASEKGYRYFDWKDCAGDAEGGYPSAGTLVQNVIKDAGRDHLIVLMHDTAATKNTVEALPDIIRSLKEAGYRFDVVENYPQPAQHTEDQSEASG